MTQIDLHRIAKAVERATKKPLPEGITIDRDTRFDDLGVDGLAMFEVIFDLEDDLNLPMNMLADDADTFGELMDLANHLGGTG